MPMHSVTAGPAVDPSLAQAIAPDRVVVLPGEHRRERSDRRPQRLRRLVPRDVRMRPDHRRGPMPSTASQTIDLHCAGTLSGYQAGFRFPRSIGAIPKGAVRSAAIHGEWADARLEPG